ncbi:hypothetical protein ACNQGP_05060 [Flavobacterium sp. GT2N3]|uniref:hypothetical protein n=1 Tax=Flavobacterium sp. GT2N3 TaxID=3401733 RepID=UPI003AB074B7
MKSKNNSIDERGLSQTGAEQCLELWQPLGHFYYELRRYTRQHQNIQELKSVINNQLHALDLDVSNRINNQLAKKHFRII